MKICEKCGKEFAEEFLECPNCSTISLYEQALKNVKTMNIVSIALIVVGIICALFVNAWLGAVLCFVAEIVCLLPNTKVQKLFKKNNVGTSDKKKLKSDLKAFTKDLKTKDKNYKLSFLVAVIALILLIAFVCVDSALTGWANSLPDDLKKDSYGSGIVNQIDTIGDLHQYANSDFRNYGNNSSNSQSSSAFAGEPVVGDFYFLYKESYFVNPDTGKTSSTQPILPYITGLLFVGDGTGLVTCATNDGVKSYSMTWTEPENSETETTKCYIVKYNNESVFVFYHKEDGYCFTTESNIVTYYFPYSE